MMQVLDRPGDLIDNILLVFLFQDIFSDDPVQIYIHVLECQINIFLILRLEHMPHFNDILMIELLKITNLSKGSLGVC